METQVGLQQNVSIWKQSDPKNRSIHKQSDYNKIQVFGNSQITTKYQYLIAQVRLQQNTSPWKHQSNHNKILVFRNTCQITTTLSFPSVRNFVWCSQRDPMQ